MDLDAGVERTGTRSTSLPKGRFDGILTYLAGWNQHVGKVFLATSYLDIDI